jgi:hypothetical protein
MSCPSFHYTPKETCKELIKDISFNENEETLEPCIGRDKNFYDLIPGKKEWGEIENGRDFFKYDYGRKFHKIIVNPPYKCNITKKNIAYKFLEKCIELCLDECWCLLNLNMFNSLTPKRLKELKIKNFEVVFIRILNIKIWRNRYYWVCFKKNKKGILSF